MQGYSNCKTEKGVSIDNGHLLSSKEIYTYMERLLEQPPT